ncbi:MAG: hypothetical protein HYU74_09090 [Dechloromonas sp.]|nr:hypothetical protein [Dechloromonas sp.]
MKNAAPVVPAELAQEGIRQLIQARCAAMGSIAGELQAILPAAIAASASGIPEGLPDWAVSAFTEAGIKEGSICWKTARASLARRTADLIANTPLGEQVTGGSLAGFLGLDLFAFASEGWAEIEPVGTAMAGEAK